jgi:hypothetical protein
MRRRKMKATELLSRQMQLVHARISGLAGFSTAEWAARPPLGGNAVGFTAWHMVATRDWIIRALLQAERPLGWDAKFGAGVSMCHIPFGMDTSEADRIADAITPAEVVAYSAAVTEDMVRWLSTADEASLDAAPPNGHAHFAFSPRYQERAYRWQLEEDPDDMSRWPSWMLLTRPSFAHCLFHLEEIEFARKSVS